MAFKQRPALTQPLLSLYLHRFPPQDKILAPTANIYTFSAWCSCIFPLQSEPNQTWLRMNWIHYNDTTRQAVINLDEIKAEVVTAWQLDQLGSIKEKFSLHEGENIIDCSHWASGTWFIKVEAKQGVQLKKILIKG